MLLTSWYCTTEMAAPDDVEDIPDPSSAHEDSSDETGDNDKYMDDCEPMPHQSARASAKCLIVTSPPGQPPPQRPKVDYSVCYVLAGTRGST